MSINRLTAKRLILPAILLGMTLASYWRIKDLQFVYYDDGPYVTHNLNIQNGLNRSSFAWSMTTLYEYWHPVTWISHALDCSLYALNPAGHHLTNLIIHLANVALLFFLLQVLTGAIWRSAFVAGLFALHPLNVESVAWVAERKNVLSTFFFILAIWAYVSYVRKPGLKRYIGVAILFALGLMSKPMVVTLPFLLLVLDYWPLGRYGWRVAAREVDIKETCDARPLCDCAASKKFLLPHSFVRLALEKTPLLVLAILGSIITLVAQKKDGAVARVADLGMGLRLENALVSYVKYIEKMVWPQGLAILYPFPLQGIPFWQVAGATLFLLATTVFIWRARRFKYLLVGWLWYLGTLVPVIGLIQVGQQARADRYAYIPLIGIFIALVWGLGELLPLLRWAGRPLPAAGVLLLIGLGLATYHQTSYWHDQFILFRHAQDVTKDTYIAYALGIDLAEVGRLDEAVEQFSKAQIADPFYYKAQDRLGMALVQMGRLDEAIIHFRLVLDANPDSPDAYNRLGAVLLDKGRADEAIPLFESASHLNPNHASAWANLGSAYEEKGQLRQALAFYSTAAEIAIQFAESGDQHNANLFAAQLEWRMGNLLAETGKTDEAANRYLEALRFEPDYEPARRSLSSVSGVKR